MFLNLLQHTYATSIQEHTMNDRFDYLMVNYVYKNTKKETHVIYTSLI